MKIIAHRCGTDRHPGLTWQAAQYSLEAGADYVEMDVRYTRDLHPVICHDRDARLFGEDANICDLALAEFLPLRHRDAPVYCAHSLEHMLGSGLAPILLHIKEGGERMPILLELLRARDCEAKVVLGVTAAEDAARVKRFNPAIPVLAFMPSLESALEFAGQGADILRLWEPWADEDAIRRAQALGKEVWIMAKGPFTGYTDGKNLLRWQRLGVGGVLVNEVNNTILQLRSVT